MSFGSILQTFNDVIWSGPLIIGILFVGFFLTFRLKFFQIFQLKKAFYFLFHDEKGGPGEISSFGALCTALSATIGTGNIVGVATAICLGGPGALFWMVFAAFLGMATKYAEGLLAVKYRKIQPNGRVLGGPFYYIETGLKEIYNKNFKWLAYLFAVFGVCAGLFGIGTLTQVNSISTAMNVLIPSDTFFSIENHNFTYTTVISGAIITILVALVLIGGLRRIAKVATIIVPFMVISYVGICLFMLIYNAEKILPACQLILESAFSGGALQGGAIGTLMIAMQKGIARGIFSNEAGLGSAPIAAAAAKTNNPARQGLVCMTGTFIDTIIVCSMTGLAVITTGAWLEPGLEGAAVTLFAFNKGLPFTSIISETLLSFSLAIFAFTTILGWNYYSEKCLEYILGAKKPKAQIIFRCFYILAVFLGPYLTVQAVWTIADIFNGLMAFPNLIAILLLNGVILKESQKFKKGN